MRKTEQDQMGRIVFYTTWRYATTVFDKDEAAKTKIPFRRMGIEIKFACGDEDHVKHA